MPERDPTTGRAMRGDDRRAAIDAALKEPAALGWGIRAGNGVDAGQTGPVSAR